MMPDMDDSPNFTQEKGTDYPAQPNTTGDGSRTHSRYSTDTDYRHERASEQVANPRVEEYTPPPKPRILHSKFLWLAVAGVVVVAGIFGYRFYQSLPFRVDDGNIILRDSHGGTLEIDTTPELPASFPSDIPIYPGAVLQPTGELQGSDAEQRGSIYRWRVPAPLEDVGFWYADELERSGWDIPLRQPAGTTGVIYTVTKGERGFLIELRGVSSTRTDVSLIFAEQFPE